MPREPDHGITCETCDAACCRLEVLCLTETGVPQCFTRRDAWGGTVMDRLDDGWCAALDRDSLRCRIYAWRPLVCREFVMGGPDCRIERGRLDDGWCAALDRDSLRCRIYAWRPLVCREFVMGGPDCRIERGIAE